MSHQIPPIPRQKKVVAWLGKVQESRKKKHDFSLEQWESQKQLFSKWVLWDKKWSFHNTANWCFSYLATSKVDGVFKEMRDQEADSTGVSHGLAGDPQLLWVLLNDQELAAGWEHRRGRGSSAVGVLGTPNQVLWRGQSLWHHPTAQPSGSWGQAQPVLTLWHSCWVVLNQGMSPVRSHFLEGPDQKGITQSLLPTCLRGCWNPNPYK